MNEPRLGLINYVNSLPFVQPIASGLVKVNAQVVMGEPAKLNALYANQELELGAISAFSYLEQGNFKLMPGISISSLGAVGSVLFFSKVPIDKRSLKIAVPAASATSINMLALLLFEHTKQKPIFIVSDKPDIADETIDGALVIGDRALLIDSEWSKKYWRYDLGQWWYDTFSLPAVFALFVARLNWYDLNDKGSPLLFEEINEGLIRATQIGLSQNFATILKEAENRTGIDKARLKTYFEKELNFFWSDQHNQALQKYELLCRQQGILPEVVQSR